MNIDPQTKALCVSKITAGLLSNPEYTIADGGTTEPKRLFLDDQEDREGLKEEGFNKYPTLAVVEAFSVFYEIQNKIQHDEIINNEVRGNSLNLREPTMNPTSVNHPVTAWGQVTS
jgi:hypothetical protein